MCKQIALKIELTMSIWTSCGISRDPLTFPRGFGELTLRLVVGISLVDRKVFVRLARRLPDRLPSTDGLQPCLESLPSLFVIAPLAWLGHA